MELEKKIEELTEELRELIQDYNQLPKYYKRIFQDGRFKMIEVSKEDLRKELE